MRDRAAPNQNDVSRGKAEFSVWRLDDNNNEFLVRGSLTEEEALALVREYEAKGHRQGVLGEAGEWGGWLFYS